MKKLTLLAFVSILLSANVFAVGESAANTSNDVVCEHRAANLKAEMAKIDALLAGSSVSTKSKKSGSASK